MPILLAIVLAIAAMLVRITQGLRPLPAGHHLLIKTIAVLVLFVIYNNAMWSSRRNFCIQMTGLIHDELRVKLGVPEAEWVRALKQATLDQLAAEGRPAAPWQTVDPKGSQQSAKAAQDPGQVSQPQPADAISAADLSKMIDAAKSSPVEDERRYSSDAGALVRLGLKREVWHTSPRGYVLSAVEAGWLSVRTASSLLNSYFYLTHGVYVLDLAWQARAQLSPHWGIYEIGVLSPILRAFLPQNRQLKSMDTELKAAKIIGVSPTAWTAAYVDFGAAGAVVYVLIWGFAAGWSRYGARHSSLATPSLLLTFILASILLSPIQGPLGIANSALVLLSMAVVGIAIDLAGLGDRKRRAALNAEASRSGHVGAA